MNGGDKGLEQIWIHIKQGHKKLFLGALYIPPSTSATTHELHMSVLNEIYEMADNNTTLMLSADFNLPRLTWTQSKLIDNTYLPDCIPGQAEDITMETCDKMGLMQINGSVNNNNRILDLFWTNAPGNCVCYLSEDNFLRNESHHKALRIDFEFSTQ